MSTFFTGIVGLPNVGKSTLFNAMTRAGADVANYPFCTIDPNVGVVELPDPRLDQVAVTVKPEKVTPAVVQFVDIAGLVKGASKGEGLGNQFLGHIREVDALVHVVRCFADDDVAHVEGSIDPVRDVGIIDTELILADLETVLNRKEKTERLLKTGEQKYKEELGLFSVLQEGLEAGTPVRSLTLNENQRQQVREFFLLTDKRVLYVANVSEDAMTQWAEGQLNAAALSSFRVLQSLAEAEGADVVPVCAALEAEIADLDAEEAQLFLAEMSLKEPGLARIVRAASRQLNLITFYTVKGPETRAWMIPAQTKAPQAAGTIHTDMERGFIRAEVLEWDKLIEAGSFAAARERGWLRSEGKEYVVQDGDVILFRFNV